jgi:hypothetical protein
MSKKPKAQNRTTKKTRTHPQYNNITLLYNAKIKKFEK